MTQIKPKNYFTTDKVGEYFLIQFCVSNSELIEQQENFKKELKRFPSNMPYDYKRILRELNIHSKPNFRNREEKLDSLKKEVQGLLRKKSLSKKQNKRLDSILKIKQENAKNLMKEGMEEKVFLDIDLWLPMAYYLLIPREFKFNLYEGDWFKDYEKKALQFLRINSFLQMLEKIRFLFGNTCLRSILFGIVLISFAEYIPDDATNKILAELEEERKELKNPKRFNYTSPDLTKKDVQNIESQVNAMKKKGLL